MSEGDTEFLDAIDVDYFDPNASFKLEWQDSGGTLTSADAELLRRRHISILLRYVDERHEEFRVHDAGRRNGNLRG